MAEYDAGIARTALNDRPAGPESGDMPRAGQQANVQVLNAGLADLTANGDTPAPDTTFVPGDRSSAGMPVAGTLLNNRFRIGRELGRGGMAVVYLAEEIETGRQVAVKMMQTRLEGTARQRFTREFSTIASIKHPSCLEVFEYGESDTGPFFAMELFAGEPATALIGQPLAIALKALYQIAEAVDYVHSRRIIHRDIKPGNILVRSKSDGSGFDVRLADFGLAKFANTSSSLSGETGFLGTIAYCAPEQIMRDELDHRCDIYSFGLVCYEVLAGRHPYSEVRKNVQALVAKQLRDVPPSVRSSNPELDPAIAAAVMQMLAKDAGKRPQSTVQFRNAIAEFLNLTIDRDKPESESEGRQLVGTFVSREQEKRLLDSLLAENLLLDGNSSDDWLEEQPAFLAVLTGQAGLGKSSLLRQAARSAMANGAHVYEGRCLAGNLAPFQPFVEIIRQLLIEQEQLRSSASEAPIDRLAQTTIGQAADPTVRLDRIFQEYAPELLRIAPELKNLLPGEAFSNAENSQQSDHVLRAIASFFAELGKVQRVCLLLEDLHWADNSSLSLLACLGDVLRTERREAAMRRESAPCVFVCATTRPENDYPLLAAPLGRLRQQNNLRTIELTPFDEPSVRSLAAALLGAVPEQIDGRLIEYMTSQCFGNPFYVSQTLREFRNLGRITFQSGRWQLAADVTEGEASITDSVRAALRERVRGLEPLPAKILSVAAVIGAVVDVELLRDVVGHHDQFEFLDALDLLLARQILNETGQARRVAFSHDLVREAALERQASSQQTKRLHEAVALRLESLASEGKPVSNAKLAEHFLSADIRDKAFHYLLQAGSDAVAAFAYPDAIRVLEKAREIMPAGTATEMEFQLCIQLAKAYAAIDTLDSAEAMYRETIRTATQPLDRAEALHGLGDVLSRRREPHEALNAFVEALRVVRHPLRTNPVSTVFDILVGTMFMFLLPESIRRKMKFCRRTEQERSLAFRITHSACHSQVDVSLLRYLQLCQWMVIRAHQTGMPDDMASGYAKYAFNLCLYGTPYYPFQFAKRAGELAMAALRPETVAFAKTFEAGIRGMIAGDLLKALGDAETALKGFDRLGESYFRQAITHIMRHLCEYYGDSKRELAYADEELRMAELSGDWEKATWGLYGRADALARAGEFSGAQGEMKKAFELLGDHRSVVTRPVAVCTDAYVLLQASNYDQAFARALTALRLTERGLGVFFFSAKAYPLAIEAGLGPNWHDHSAHAAIRGDKGRMRTINWVLWKCLGIGALFMVARAHSLRVRGRHAFVVGKRRKAIRLLDRAISTAEKQGSPYELARTLLDRSLINPETAAADREKGQSLLRELHSVLPEAEQLAFAPISQPRT